jgi:GT2 family glycosyltransferase
LLAIIIPNYNGLEHLKTCYPSIHSQSYRDFKLIFVDNGSADESVGYTKSVFPEAHIIELGHNTGFAKAVNEGIKHALEGAGIKYILLLNNDIELDVNFLKAGVDTFRSKENVSLIASKMLNYYERDTIDDCGDVIKRFGGGPYARGYREKDKGQYDKEEFIFGASAGAGFYKREVFEQAGLFDESFFAYYEDVDISFRAQLMGFKCLYQPKAVCYHKRGGTVSNATGGFQTEMCERNLVLMRIKDYPPGMYLIHQPLFIGTRVVRYFKFLRYHPFTVFYHAVRGYVRGLFLCPFQLAKRLSIQKKKVVTTAYIKSLFGNG